MAALEILVGTSAVRHLIREGKVHQIPSAMQTGAKDGMVTMDAALLELVQKGRITREEAASKSENPDQFSAAPTRRPVAR